MIGYAGDRRHRTAHDSVCTCNRSSCRPLRIFFWPLIAAALLGTLIRDFGSLSCDRQWQVLDDAVSGNRKVERDRIDPSDATNTAPLCASDSPMSQRLSQIHDTTICVLEQQLVGMMPVLARASDSVPSFHRAPFAFQLAGTVRSLQHTWPTFVKTLFEPLYELTGQPAHVFAVLSVFDGRVCDAMAVREVFGSGPKNWSTHSYRLCDVYVERQGSEQFLLRSAQGGTDEMALHMLSHLRGIALTNERRVAFQQQQSVRYDLVGFSRTDSRYFAAHMPFPWRRLLAMARNTTSGNVPNFWAMVQRTEPGPPTVQSEEEAIVPMAFQHNRGTVNGFMPPYTIDIFMSTYYRAREARQIGAALYDISNAYMVDNGVVCDEAETRTAIANGSLAGGEEVWSDGRWAAKGGPVYYPPIERGDKILAAMHREVMYKGGEMAAMRQTKRLKTMFERDQPFLVD